MDRFISKVKFLHDDEDKNDKYRDEFQNWINENEEKITVQQLLTALDQIGKKFTEDSKYPIHQSNGYCQAEYLVDNVLSLIGDKINDGSKPNQFHEPCLNVIYKLMQSGMGTIHFSIIMKLIDDSYIELEDHMKAFKTDKLQKSISILCTPVKKREDTESETFYDEYASFFNRFIDIFEVTQLIKSGNMKPLIDFAAHVQLDYGELDEDSLRKIVQIADHTFDYFEDSWKAYRDVDHLKSLTRKITASVKTPEFPRNGEDERSKRDMLERITEISQEKGMAEPLCPEIFDVLETTLKSKNKNDELLFNFIGEILQYFRDQEEDNIKKKPNLFKLAIPRYKQCIEKAEMKFLIHTDVAPYGASFLETTMGEDRKLVALWIDLVVPLLNRPCENCFSACYTILGNYQLISWKEHQEAADEIFKAIASVKLPKDIENEEDFIENFSSCVNGFIRGMKNSRVLKKYSVGVLVLVVGLLEKKRDSLYEMASDVAENLEINVKEHKDAVIDALRRLHKLLKDDDLPWNSDHNLKSAVEYLLRNMISEVKDSSIFLEKDLQLMVDICITCLSHDGLGDMAGTISGYLSIANEILTQVIEWLAASDKLKLADKLIPLIIQKYEEDEDGELLTTCISAYLYKLGQHGPATLAPYVGQLLKIYADKDISEILSAINSAYLHNPAPLKEHFQKLLKKLLTSGDQMTTMWLSQIFHGASKKQSELFTEENIKDIIAVIRKDPSNQPTLLQIIQELCKRQPGKVAKHIDLLMLPPGMLSSWINDMLCTVALFEKKVAPKVLDYLLSMLKNEDKANLLTALNSIRMLGLKYLDILKPKRAAIEGFKTLDPDGQNMRQMILDLIDGKTTEEMRKQIESQQNALTNIESKVDEVDETVKEVKEDVQKQGDKLDNVTNTVTEQGQRLDQVEETVDETVLKVEEIDSKTLSHAPYWSRDISKLLNPQEEHDWRLLSSRLGYSNDDIRGWAQQADPCMAMLNEWYATRKTSEATLAILTQLQEMHRMDAAIIVENAMKNAEAVVEDEEFEYASPPPIFISYQWGHQEEVKLLKKHLEMAGYECWMDIGQMGGGDRLFEKIDNGIRTAKVVISCITNKYTKSPNCNREVNLSLGLHKPIIPLLLEQCPWPPPGSMGPIFSESLFIRFFQRKGEETTDQRYWSEPKFLELLMQLNMNGLPPDEGKIERIYKNWWMPIEQEIKIDKSKTRDGGQAAIKTSTSTDENTESPEVFISYQWGKQKNIIKLYERLSSMGFSCWLDIKQMGGGDSLYDKIDKGIRNSKVVLSCVTQKYALSANCRREVSLADALKKPLLPLLLEKMTWPPAGPMSMVMTQLLYIGFTEESVQTTWTGPQFDELIGKINQHIPSVKNEKDKSQSKTPTTSSNQTAKQTKSGGFANSSKPEPSKNDKTETGSNSSKTEPSNSSKTEPPKNVKPEPGSNSFKPEPPKNVNHPVTGQDQTSPRAPATEKPQQSKSCNIL